MKSELFTGMQIVTSHFSLDVDLSRSDLKPDNVLLDERGHAHITDLNIAVHYSERRLLTGVAGSMAYMGMLRPI